MKKKNIIKIIILIAGISVGIALFIGHTGFNRYKLVDISNSLFCFSLTGLYAFFAFKKYRVLILNISIVCFLLGGTEKYLKIRSHRYRWNLVNFRDTPGFFVHSDIFNHVPSANAIDTSSATVGDTVLYKVIYRSDKNRLRKTPEIKTNKNTKSIVFFGCSFTFGHGLNDDQIMANLVQKSVDSLYKVYNFACNGYGAHHMLAAIEKGLLDTIVEFEPKYFIYQCLIDHVRRAANLNWGRCDPKYILNKNGEAEYAGSFPPENPPLIWKRIKESQIANLIKRTEVNSDETKLFIEIVKKSQRLLQQKYPNSEFHMIFYDVDYWEISKRIYNDLNIPGITIHKISNIIPDYYQYPKKYYIYPPYETHPNAKVNAILANYVINHIIKKPEKKLSQVDGMKN
jgi:hypothetical protein